MSDEVEIIVPEEPVITLAVAEPGPPGAPGGANSNTILYGTTNPVPGTGADGNFYINTNTWTVFGPKAGGSWPSGASLIGAKGDKGDTGNSGADGRTIHNGSGAPSNGLGANGDFYVDTTGLSFYGPKAAGVWPSGTSLVGPKGDTGEPGADGADGAPGAPGADGLQLRYGTGAPSNGVGANGEFYIDTVTWNIYGPKSGGAWPTAESLKGAKGDQGDPGADGAPGANGADGKTVRYGAGAPSNGLGVDGDFYINTSNNFIYGPKAGGVWPSGTSLVGPAGTNGTNGTNGAAGADGKTIRYGSGAPSNGLGVDGDFYINTANNYIYGPKASGTWPSGTSLVGPAGASDITSSSVPTPESGKIKFFRQERGGRDVVAIQSPDGIVANLGFGNADFWNGYTRYWKAGANVTTPALMGMTNSTTGTPTVRSMVANNGWYGQTPKIGYLTAATNNAAAGTRHAVVEFHRGDTAGLGGFLYGARFSPAENASDSGFKFFVGMRNTTTVLSGATDPMTQTNVFGVASGAGDGTLRVIHNDGADNCTEIDLGSNFPSNTSQTDVYDVFFYSAPNGSAIHYHVDRRSGSTGAITHSASGDLTTDLPANNVRLTPEILCATGTSPVASGLDVFWQIVWTPY